MREEYEFTPDELRNGIRGKYAVRFQEGVNLVQGDSDLIDDFPDSEAEKRRSVGGGIAN